MVMNIIETKDLTKNYGDFEAVSGLNLHIKKGSVYGFLGPNGAGKSTTMRGLRSRLPAALRLIQSGILGTEWRS